MSSYVIVGSKVVAAFKHDRSAIEFIKRIVPGCGAKIKKCPTQGELCRAQKRIKIEARQQTNVVGNVESYPVKRVVYLRPGQFKL